ncbi:MAG: DUF3857 domain-containing protein [Candidatus Acidiferrales bacterium]
MWRLFCSSAVVVLLSLAFGARTAPAGDEWLPISPEDLALKDNPASPGTGAMILYRQSEILSSESIVDNYVRIKIFTQEGVKYGDVLIEYQKGFSELQNLRGRTIRPNGEVIDWDKKTFDVTVMKNRDVEIMAKKFTLRGIEPGCIIEYKVREHFEPRYLNLTWNVQQKLFMRTARFSIKPPSHSPFPLFYRHFNLPPSAVPQRQSDGSFTLEIHDLPGLEEEANMPPETALRARVEFFYGSPADPANETSEQYWTRMGKLWGGLIDQFLNNPKLLGSEAAHATNAEDTPEIKLRKLFARAQAVRNLNFESARTKKDQQAESLKPNNNVEDLIKRNYGTSRQINFFFVGLARAAGFQATIVYVAPRSRYFFMPELQDSKQLSSDLVWVQAGGSEYYLEPSSRFFPFGMLPWYDTQVSGVRVQKNGADLVTTPLPPSSDAILSRNAVLDIDEEGNVSGTLQVEYRGQRAALWREAQRNEDEAGRQKKLDEQIKGWLPAGATFTLTKVSNWDDVDQPLRVEGTVKAAGFGNVAGRRLLLPAAIFQSPYTKGFVSTKRVNMIYFHFPFEEVDDMKVRTPAGYKIETAPETKQVGGGPVFYQLSGSAQGNEVEIKRQLTVKGVSFPVETYSGLRTFFNTAKSDDESQIVFTTADTAKNQ